jgi:hypothetical protein
MIRKFKKEKGLIAKSLPFIIGLLFGVDLLYPTLGYGQETVVGNYTRSIGVHGSFETYMFNNDLEVTYLRKVLTLASEEYCIGKYHVDQDTLRIIFEDSRTADKPTYKITKEKSGVISSDSVLIKLRAFYRRITNLAKIQANAPIQYDSATLTDRLGVVIMDAKRAKISRISSYSPVLGLDCPSACIIQVKAYNSYPIELELKNYQGKEIFIDVEFYQKYRQDCSRKEAEFLMLDRSNKQLILQDIESKKSIILNTDN